MGVVGTSIGWMVKVLHPLVQLQNDQKSQVMVIKGYKHMVGDIIGKIIRYCILPLFVLGAMGGGSAFAQSMAFSYDLNMPSNDDPQYYDQRGFTTDSGLRWGWGLYSRPVCSDCAATRIGLVIGYQAMTVKLDGYDMGIKYQTVNVQAAVDRRIYGSPRLNLTIGVALGLSFISNNFPTNELFGNFPDSSLLVSPNLKVVLPLFENVSATVEARGAIFTGDRETTFPFESGGILAVGIEVHSGPKVKGG